MTLVHAETGDTPLYLFTDGRRSTWAEVRAWILDRDAHTCQTCGATANEVDHIWPRRWGGDDSIQNLRALCGTCNKNKGVKITPHTAETRHLLAGLLTIGDRVLADMDGPGFDIRCALDWRISREGLDCSETLATLRHLLWCLEHASHKVQIAIEQIESPPLSPTDDDFEWPDFEL